MEEKRGLFNRMLNGIEVIGNKLPNPVTIFFILTFAVMIISLLLAKLNTSVTMVNGEQIEAINLLSVEQLKIILSNVVKSFQGFAPLGLVLVVMIGAGLAEKSGFMETAMKLAVLRVPNKALTFMVIFVGMLSQAAGDAGFIILPPLAAILFLSAGRHPLLGMFTAYAAVAAGFSANIMVTMLDVLLVGFTNEAAATIDPNAIISPAANLYFMVVSTFILTIAGTFVSEKILAPRFANEDIEKFRSAGAGDATVSSLQARGIKKALIAVGIYAVILVLLAIIPLGEEAIPFLASKSEAGNISVLNNDAPLMAGIVPIITFLFFLPGYIYGKITGSIKSDHDVVGFIGKSLGEMGPYILLAFAASQFITLFNQSNMGTILAVSGADGLETIGMPGTLMFIIFILFVAFINLFIGSASAKWALLAPIFVPMFLALGYDPAVTQVAYRIGESFSNPISPLFPYFPILLGFIAKYKKDVGMGTIISNMIPFSLVFGIVWIIQFIIFMMFNIPFGV